jgi:hypothetical protein
MALSPLTPAGVAQNGLTAAGGAGGTVGQPGGERLAVELNQGKGQGNETLPIRRITLYRSGVGAFERQGMIDGNARVSLRFDVAQINDILKSLQLLDLDGGRIDSVSYSSKDPIERRLGSFSVPIADNPSLATLLSRLRGAGIAVQAAEGAVTGTVLGVETRKVQPPGSGKDAPVVDTPFVTIATGQGIRAVNINGITSFNLTDQQLADELNRALAAVADTRAERVKSVDLALSGAGARRVAVRYVHETPVWKTSYRLIIDDKAEDKGAKKPEAAETLALQGWAIVENTTDNDWRDVKLGLVSGRPVSFRMDLSEPLYMGRPEVAVPTIPGVMPKNYSGGVADKAPMLAPASAAPGSPGGGGGREMARKAGAPPARGVPSRADAMSAAEARDEGGTAYFGVTTDDLTRYAPASRAKAGEVGEVFFFEVDAPVTIERQRSAMIPFLRTNITGRRVSIYTQGDRADHPMRGVQLTNSSDMQLLPGPLAVFDGTAYAGDATINQVSPGDKRLLAYAVDLDVAVTTKPEGSGEVVKIRIVGGAFEVTVKNRDTLAYTFANKDLKRSRTVIVEHPQLPGWELKAPAQAAEKTQELYRFEVDVPAGKSETLSVVQERVERQSVGIDSYDLATVVGFSQQGRLSPAVLAAFQELARRRGALAEAERALAETDRQVGTNTTEQTRISQTMSGLPQNGELYADYTKELKDLNTALKALRAQRNTQGQQVETLRRDLNAFVAGLNVE